MIDAASCIQNDGTDLNRTQLKDEIGPVVLASEEPPGEDFVLLLPAEIMGFHMHDKRWGVSHALPSVSRGQELLTYCSTTLSLQHKRRCLEPRRLWHFGATTGY